MNGLIAFVAAASAIMAFVASITGDLEAGRDMVFFAFLLLIYAEVRDA